MENSDINFFRTPIKTTEFLYEISVLIYIVICYIGWGPITIMVLNTRYCKSHCVHKRFQQHVNIININFGAFKRAGLCD